MKQKNIKCKMFINRPKKKVKIFLKLWYKMYYYKQLVPKHFKLQRLFVVE